MLEFNQLENNHQEYEIKDGYRYLMGAQPQFPWHRVIWNPLTVAKHQFTMWLLVHEKLRTKDNLQFMQVSPLCVLCSGVDESCRHLFFECSWSKQLLQLAANWVGVDVMHFKFQNWLRWLRYGFKEKWRRQVVTAMVAACAYGVWSERNNRIFRQQQFQPHQTFRLLQAELGTKLVFSKWAKASGPNNFLIDRIRAAI
ncbi:hypothetical protein RIF29_08334 [Crotalaria pallida]|uniref:Reverse transcriptase zinc-binding domain-containing protein n=1 Tax=Crotalaria pallida TaxID=3830 RepID=A0AAN9IIX3_CROPI